MTTAIWPIDIFKPQDVSVDPLHRNTSSSIASNSFSQTVSNSAGLWKVTYSNIPIYGSEAILQWRSLDMLTEGKLNPILVPAWDFPRSPFVINGFGTQEQILESVIPHSDDTPHSDETPYSTNQTTFTVNGNRAVGTTYVQINKISNATLRVGHRFSVGERFYQIKSIVAQNSSICNCYIWPPIRDEITSGETCNFDNPYIRVRLLSDSAMKLPLTINNYSFVTLDFIEDV